jgi:hypothetical protein
MSKHIVNTNGSALHVTESGVLGTTSTSSSTCSISVVST